VFAITELVAFVKSVVPYTYYPNEFPVSAEDNSGYVRIHSGTVPSQWTSQRRPSIQIVVRGDNGPTSEKLANTIYEEFHRRRDCQIGDEHILAIFADQSAPLYLGLDDHHRVLYSINFTAIMLNSV